MDDRGHRPAPANRATDRDSATPSAMHRHREGSDQQRHRPSSPTMTWRSDDAEAARDAIRHTYR